MVKPQELIILWLSRSNTLGLELECGWLTDIFNDIVCRNEMPVEKGSCSSNTKTWKRSKWSKKLSAYFITMSHLQNICTRATVMYKWNNWLKKKIIHQHAGFRLVKSNNVYIENGFEEKKITDTVFVDLKASYDIVNHELLLKKIYGMIAQISHLWR